MRRTMAGLVGLLLFFANSAAAEDGLYSFTLEAPVVVMTRNLYTGSDLFQLLDVDTGNLLQVLRAVGDRVIEIVETNFPERAQALAAEIERVQPHLIGLQEVERVRFQYPGDFLVGNPQPAEDVLYDYLDLLLAALQARGLAYEVAAVLETVDLELPALVDLATGFVAFDVRLTDRDVILRRSDVSVSNVTARHYSDIFQAGTGDLVLPLPKGFTAVDAEVAGRTYRFVNTHLEVRELDDGATQARQAEELIEVLAGENRPVILVGDFNSRPTDPVGRPYDRLRQAGFVDAWRLRPEPFDPGLTCCQAGDLTNTDSRLSERVDLVWVRNDLGRLPFSVVGRVEAAVVGDDPEARTASGLWPSDHAGVGARIEIPALFGG